MMFVVMAAAVTALFVKIRQHTDGVLPAGWGDGNGDAARGRQRGRSSFSRCGTVSPAVSGGEERALRQFKHYINRHPQCESFPA
jgi:hypothetical protein